MIENVVLIKINQTYKEGMTAEELYQTTSVSWVASFKKTKTRDLKYYCAIYQNKIIEVYDFLSSKEEMPKRNPSRYILEGKVVTEAVREQLVGIDVSTIHKGSGNPIKYTNYETLLRLKAGEEIRDNTEHNEDAIFSEGINLIPHIHQYIKSKGFNYSLDNIKNLYLSLRSKPFVIISGISGTGKTKIVQLFAESIGATEDNGQLTLIPVRPDWSDGSELLGYRDIKGEFVEGIFTGVVRAASEHLDRPYFVLLDEMNLARVEYYFSDVLSIMESRKKVDGVYTSSPLLPDIDGELTLPPNLYLIGTVNMDETTHPFSKKVLDRANTIEFNDIDLNDFSFLESAREAVPHISLANTSLEASYVQLQDGYAQYKELIHLVSQKLDAINTYMKPIHAQIGYRVRDEICFYLMHNQEGSLLSEDAAFDYCVMQKILPRLAGSGQKIRTALDNLYTHLTEEDEVRYPQSAEKVQEMLGRLDDDGFTSFWIS